MASDANSCETQQLALWRVAALVVGALLMSSPALALERPGDPSFAWETQSGPWSNGLYVIGDSISFAVPYDQNGNALGVHVWQRSGFGWSTYAHRHQAWGNGFASFEDAALSPASVVFVQLGTNDTGCMRGVGLCALGDYPTDEAERAIERQRMNDEVQAAAERLVDAGKCVVWAGPREIERADSGIEEAQRFNQLLRNIESAYPGRFFYLDYSGFTFSNPDLRASLDEAPNADGIHPQTSAGRQVIADLAFWFAVAWCELSQRA